MLRWLRENGGSHYAVRAFTVIGIVVVHSEVVTHLMRDCCCDHRNQFTVIRGDSTGAVKRAHCSFPGLADDSTFELLPGQQVRIVVAMQFYQLSFPIFHEVDKRFFTVFAKLDFVSI